MRLHGAIIVDGKGTETLMWAPLKTVRPGKRRFPWHVLKSEELLAEFLLRFRPTKFDGVNSSTVYHLIASEHDVETWFESNTPLVALTN